LAAILPVDDSGVVAAAAAAAQLKLPHNAPQAAAAARDKLLMRNLMAAAGAPCPPFRAFHTDDDPAEVAAQVPYPCVLKPTGLNGSRGVMRADHPAEFVARATRLARLLRAEYGPGSHPYLVEAFIPGFEVALEGLLDAGRLHVLALFDKPDPLDGPFFEETIYVTPSRLPPDVQAAIAAAAAQAAAALGLCTGPVHAELRVNDGEPWLLEIAGRSIGGLCGRTLRFGLEGAAMSLEELIVRQACGLPWSATSAAPQAASGVMMIPIPAAGILAGVTGIAAAQAVPGIEGVEISAPLHQTLTPLPEGESYLGFIFARAATPAAVEAALRAAHACLQFSIVPEFGLTMLG
jgi:biotin carboxylase